jgi:hypothetical protein
LVLFATNLIFLRSSLQNHDFNAICSVCTGVCGVISPVSAPSSTFIIPTDAGAGGEITVTFAQPLPVANAANANALVLVPAAALVSVVITGISGAGGPFTEGAYATDAAGNLKALMLLSNGRCVFFSSCGPFVVQDGNNRKRNLFMAQTTGLGGGSATAAIGDPHIRGLFGINIEFFGKGDRVYSLVTAPSFEINMRLSNAGPDERFITSLSVLYRNTSYVITPWGLNKKKAEIINHFESLGSKVAFTNTGSWTMTIELCPHHKLKFTAHHTTGESILNYLNFEFDVPGCHDSYGGVLGQTYQCKWAKETFLWSREMEESFRVPTMKSASRTYSPATMIDCAAENDFGPRL